ncbi:holin [Actinotalea sp.]|uniref:holin n=1 Tax=Actinotalea sp. TaxID=1872145 RepID=UPI0035635057
MLSALLSRAWWAAAIQRALRSALVVLVPLIPGILSGDSATILAAASTAALMAVLSLATALASLPEVDGMPRAWWVAALDRTVKTFAQALIAAIPAVTLIHEVPWTLVLMHAAAAAAGSLVLAVISILPESLPVTIPIDTVLPDGRTVTDAVAGVQPADAAPTGRHTAD